jgi:hypothetical protein
MMYTGLSVDTTVSDTADTGSYEVATGSALGTSAINSCGNAVARSTYWQKLPTQCSSSLNQGCCCGCAGLHCCKTASRGHQQHKNYCASIRLPIALKLAILH